MTDQQRIAEIKALCDAAQTRIAKVSGADLTAPGISISIYNDIAPTCERNLRKLAGNANQYIPFLLTQLAASQRREKTSIRDLEEIATGANACEYCKNTGEQCKLCGVPVQDDTSPSNFEWREPQDEEGETDETI